MKFLGNIIWLIFGGLEAAIGYFTASLALAVTIIGLPWAWQTVKIGILCLCLSERKSPKATPLADASQSR